MSGLVRALVEPPGIRFYEGHHATYCPNPEFVRNAGIDPWEPLLLTGTVKLPREDGMSSYPPPRNWGQWGTPTSYFSVALRLLYFNVLTE